MPCRLVATHRLDGASRAVGKAPPPSPCPNTPSPVACIAAWRGSDARRGLHDFARLTLARLTLALLTLALLTLARLTLARLTLARLAFKLVLLPLAWLALVLLALARLTP